MLTAERARQMTDSMKWVMDTVDARIGVAAMNGLREVKFGFDFDNIKKDYGPEFNAWCLGYYGKNQENIFEKMLRDNGFTVIFQSMGGAVISW